MWWRVKVKAGVRTIQNNWRAARWRLSQLGEGGRDTRGEASVDAPVCCPSEVKRNGRVLTSEWRARVFSAPVTLSLYTL